MEPNRREFQKQCAFQSFCKRVLHNEACNAHDEIRRRRKREVSFCDLALHEERQLYTVDKYFQDEEAEPRYQMAGKEITPKLLLEAIRTLPEEKRTAIRLQIPLIFPTPLFLVLGIPLHFCHASYSTKQTPLAWRFGG